MFRIRRNGPQMLHSNPWEWLGGSWRKHERRQLCWKIQVNFLFLLSYLNCLFVKMPAWVCLVRSHHRQVPTGKVECKTWQLPSLCWWEHSNMFPFLTFKMQQLAHVMQKASRKLKMGFRKPTQDTRTVSTGGAGTLVHLFTYWFIASC